MTLLKFFYALKPFIPRYIQIIIRGFLVRNKRSKFKNVWPINHNAGDSPNGWSGWPEQKKFALVLSHDVETMRGQDKCFSLMEMEQQLGFQSLFNFVPERYTVLDHLRHQLTANGFEVGVHGLKHDGKLFSNKKIFNERVKQINYFLKKWNSVGFTSPSMHRNLDWIHALNIKYDISTFDTDPFEPQPEGVGTIFPFAVQGNSHKQVYVELPYTLPQDFTLFILMKEKDITIWQEKLDWIVNKGGMVLLNTHPDYMNFKGIKLKLDEYPAKYYEELLVYIKERYNNQYWNALPKDITSFLAKRKPNQQ